MGHDWPGNVRELEHVVGRAVAAAFREELITAAHLDLAGTKPPSVPRSFREAKRRCVDDFERVQLYMHLAAAGGNIAEAARRAGKNRRAFFQLMRKHSIVADGFKASHVT